ncbi:HAMP domain-containing sensor histidine kinase [Frankia sp. R43]|uniref:sensor histidine kinase n=1 Tax=Frankia sp. R43 TaxID=269536 RepID=UPI0006C9F2F4|nr:HAMP domain-containing sensor histidine kinase [Frankia sp. R43]
MTLRLRLAVAGGVVLGVLAIAGFLMIQSVWTAQVAQIDQQLTTGAAAAVSLGEAGPLPDLPAPAGPAEALPDAVSAIRSVQNGLNYFYVAVLSGDRRTVILEPAVAAGQAPQVPAGGARPLTSLHAVTVSSSSGPQRWRVVFVAGTGDRDVLLAQSLAGVEAATGRIRSAMFAVSAFVLTVLTAAGYWVERLGLRPIARVTQVSDAISTGDRSRRVDTMGSRRSEAGHLARAFNVMLDEQQESRDRLQRFAADASHELRTPVSVVRGLVELWGQGHLREREDLDETMRRIGREGRRMADLVEDLMLLARLDENAAGQHGQVDLATMVRNTEREVSERYPSRRLRCHVCDPVGVPGDEVALRQVLTNLLENALVHTPPTASVSVSVRAGEAGGTAVLQVSDTGPGMSPRDAERAFDRFWRADASRSRPGSGLGLPIVAAIVAAHDGKLAFDTSPEHGTTVRIELPIAEDLQQTRI